MRRWLVLAVVLAGGLARGDTVKLGLFEVDPRTLEVRASGLSLSDAGAARTVTDLKVDSLNASWRFAESGIACSLSAESDTAQFTFSVVAGQQVEFPLVRATHSQLAYLLPIWEGKYVGADDADFIQQLAGDREDLAGWSLPVMGVEYPEQMATYVFPSAMHTSVTLTGDGGRLGAAFDHRFTKLAPDETYVVRLSIGKKDSLLEPAIRWRNYLKSHDGLLTLDQKANTLPDVRKLAGAAHVYLWGSERFSRYDARDWKGLATAIMTDSVRTGDSADFAKAFLAGLNADARRALAKIVAGDFPDGYVTGVVASAFSQAFEDPKTLDRFSTRYASFIAPADAWGDGVSAKFIHTLQDAGLDRLWLGADEPSALAKHPEAVAAAKSAGYLIGFYDSFHSIHLPGARDTWETAQFPPGLVPDPRALAISREDGAPREGFQGKGFLLAPVAARSVVEARARADLLAAHGANSVFVDCDAFGQVYDDHSPDHPAAQGQDAAERVRRMQWISSEFQVVVGSEGGVAYAVPAIAFAHGMTTPGIGWGDAEMKDKSSPFYLGAYYPPDGPAVFTKQVLLKPIYRKTAFDPRYRLPLFEAAYHDCVVTTHHWSSASLKFKEETGTQALVEMLYQLPPLYHLNHREWQFHKAEIQHHYAGFSPLHRETWDLPMTAFSYENAARTVQRTVFGEGAVEIVVNFSDTAENGIAPRSLKWRKKGEDWQSWAP